MKLSVPKDGSPVSGLASLESGQAVAPNQASGTPALTKEGARAKRCYRTLHKDV